MKTLSPSLTLILTSILVLTSIFPLASCSDDNSVASDDAYREFVCGTPSSDDRYNLTATHSGSVLQISEGYVILVDSLRGFTQRNGPIILLQKSTCDSLVDLKPFLGKEINITGGAVIPPSVGWDSVNVSGITKYVPIYTVYNLKVQTISSRSYVNNFWCGTIAPEEYVYPSKSYVRTYASSLPSSIQYNIFVHVMRKSNSGYNKESISKTILNLLNSYYNSGNISFNLVGSEYNNMEEELYRDPESYYTIAFNQNFHADALDIYVLTESAISPNFAGIARGIPSTGCVIMGENYKNYTIAHEVGHCLGLYHTHHGTFMHEGGIPELVNGSNSASAGDLIIDTPADPNSWFNNEYAGGTTLRDANGECYHPDKYNIMCYSWVGKNFSKGQFDRIYDFAGDSRIFPILNYSLDEVSHFDKTRSFEITSVLPNDKVIWNITRYKEINSPQKETLTSNTLKITSSNPEYFQIKATLTTAGGKTLTIYAQATSGAPSPAIGTLAWSVGLNGQSGATNAQNYGSPLGVSGTTNVRLEYLDPASANIPGLSFTCVTAANRVLRGLNFQLTQADCANGFLKIRASDNCGTSDDFFTIMTEVSGSYYAVNVDNGTLTFEGRAGNTSSATGPVKVPAKAPVICSIRIYDARERLVLTRTADSVSSLSIPTATLSSGDYKAVVSDGTESREVLFAI